MGHPRKKSHAYGLLAVAMVTGICGLQRLYVGKVGSGLVYLFTFGFLGIGQALDLLLVPEMVDDYNRRKGFLLPGQYIPAAHPQVVVNIGDPGRATVIGLGQAAAGNGQPAAATLSLDQRILQRCNDGTASIGQIALAAGDDTQAVRTAVDKLTAEGLLRAEIDEGGTIRYSIG